MFSPTRDLGEVGDADDLVLGGRFGDFGPDHVCRGAADSGVDFVKYVGGDGVSFGEDVFHGEHDA